MKYLFIAAFFFMYAATHAADTSAVHLYNPNANAAKDIAAAIAIAKAQKKHVLIQAGGNWCVWCLRFNKFTSEDVQMDSMINANYVLYHLNWSAENKNEAIFKKYEFAQRFGFPVFIILDEKGNRIHTQNSAYLEEGKGYNKKKIMEFLEQWTPKALDPATYKTNQ